MANRRVLAVEGGSFSKGVDKFALAAFLLTDGIQPKSLIIKRVEVDGLDATERLIETIEELNREVDVVISSSIPIAGFNLLDSKEVLKKFGIPSIFVLGERPDQGAVRAALKKHFIDWRKRIKIIEGIGEFHELPLEGEKAVLLECAGIKPAEAMRLVKRLTIFGRVPEPVRIARMVARTVSCVKVKS
ncbi:MAG: DUF99 family protein [Candidatus Methanomethyliaceae archaeon]|nr:DUF99 family protein [Candidatus Methanomethyliaceae archaeon]